MVLILQDSVTSVFIAEIPDMDFAPAVGETFVYSEGTPEELQYTVMKRLYPTLVRNEERYVRLRVRRD